MKILLIGRGKMGRLIQETAAAAGDEVVAALGRNGLDSLGRMGRTADVVMDFSRPEALPEICAYVRRTGTPLLSGTTGFSPEEIATLISFYERMNHNLERYRQELEQFHHPCQKEETLC